MSLQIMKMFKASSVRERSLFQSQKRKTETLSVPFGAAALN